MNYIKQILYELKNQKMITWISISGTALAIFLIMAIFMGDRMHGVAISPESNRQRILKGQNIDFRSDGEGSGSGMGIDYDLATRLYIGLDGIERVSFVAPKWRRSDVGAPGGKNVSVQGMDVDEEYWKIYDYQFISGKPFEKEEIESGTNIAVISESVARKIFGETDVAGRRLDIDNEPFTIKGVVKDSFALLPDGTIDFFVNFSPHRDYNGFGSSIFGYSNVRLLMQEGVEPRHIKTQVEKRYEDANRELEKNNEYLVYHQQPYTSDEMSAGTFGSNNDPQLKIKTRLRGLIYVVLLLLPAINLGSMTRSRLRVRISEIGVRRAFGAKKKNIISQIFIENLLISLAGGAIGLGLSLIFIAFLSGYFITFTDQATYTSLAPVNVAPIIWHIFDLSVFFIAFGACFILNVLSATLPAWRAAAVEPSVAIAKSR